MLQSYSFCSLVFGLSLFAGAVKLSTKKRGTVPQHVVHAIGYPFAINKSKTYGRLGRIAVDSGHHNSPKPQRYRLAVGWLPVDISLTLAAGTFIKQHSPGSVDVQQVVKPQRTRGIDHIYCDGIELRVTIQETEH